MYFFKNTVDWKGSFQKSPNILETFIDEHTKNESVHWLLLTKTE